MTQMCRSSLLVALALTSAALALPALAHAAPPTYTIARVADGDTVRLGNGRRVRLVQIDTPEVARHARATRLGLGAPARTPPTTSNAEWRPDGRRPRFGSALRR